MVDERVVVPPGHQVRIIQPAPEPGFGQLACGVWVLNFGEARHIPSGMKMLAEFAARPDPASVLWLLAAEVLEAVPDQLVFLDACANVLRQAAHVSHFAVFPDDTPSRLHFMRSFAERGFGVHYGGPDRACFVEVHKPDGSIIVGMAGPAFTLSS